MAGGHPAYPPARGELTPLSEDPAEHRLVDETTEPGHDRRRRDGQDPCRDDLADHAPLDRRVAACRPDAHDRAGASSRTSAGITGNCETRGSEGASGLPGALRMGTRIGIALP